MGITRPRPDGGVITPRKLSVNISIVFSRLATIREKFHENRCRKSLRRARARTKMLASFERRPFDLVIFVGY